MKKHSFGRRSLALCVAVLVAGVLSGCAQGNAFQSGSKPPKDEYALGKQLLNDVLRVV